MTFLRNIWYVAAWADEVTAEAMLARRFLNEPVVLFREPSGEPVALVDRCAHKLAPLHIGKLKDGVIECGYHGLQFNGRGACVMNPHGDGVIAPNAKVTAYPVAERHDAIWIWMGEAALADPSLIPDFSMVIDPATKVVRGYLNAPSHYELMSDNLLDLGHTAYLHADSLGSAAIVRSTRSARREGEKVVYELWAPDGEAPPATQMMMPQFQGEKVDHWMVSTWHAPGMIHQETGTAMAGSNKQGGEVMNGLHWLTPETDSTTHYFQALSRRCRMDDPMLDQMIQMGVKFAFVEQDFPMIAAIQKETERMTEAEMKPVVLSIDAGAVLARNVLRQKLKAEAAANATPVQKRPELTALSA